MHISVDSGVDYSPLSERYRICTWANSVHLDVACLNVSAGGWSFKSTKWSVVEGISPRQGKRMTTQWVV